LFYIFFLLFILKRKIKENNYSFPPDLDISNDAKNLISQILDKVPGKQKKIFFYK